MPVMSGAMPPTGPIPPKLGGGKPLLPVPKPGENKRGAKPSKARSNPKGKTKKG